MKKLPVMKKPEYVRMTVWFEKTQKKRLIRAAGNAGVSALLRKIIG